MVFFFGNGAGSPNRIHGVVNSGYFNLVFAKGTNLQTTIKKTADGSDYANITDTEADTGYLNGTKLAHTGSYSNGVYDGNYIAESNGAIKGIRTNSGFNLTFIGQQAWNVRETDVTEDTYFQNTSTLTLVNASDSNGIAAGFVGRFFKGETNAQANIVIEGTSLSWGNESNSNGGIVRRGNKQDKLNFTITFINEGSSNDSNADTTYVGDKYTDLATTTANGALKDSILKVQESKLVNGLNFKGANAIVTFVGDNSQSLDGTTGNNRKILEGGSASSIFTFRDSNLNAGNGTSSLQNIKGTIAFDLTHADEDMSISGTLKNMLNGGKHQVQFKAKEGENPITINRLVFVNKDDIASATSLAQLGSDGQYYKDTEVFSSNIIQANYSDLVALNSVDTENSSSLIFGKNSRSTSVALESGEVLFVGANSHGFGNTAQGEGTLAEGDPQTSTNTSGVTTLGNSTGGTLTFIDAGELKVANIQNGKGTINLIGSTRIELQDLSTSSNAGAGAGSNPSLRVTTPSTPVKTLTLYKAGDGVTRTAPITGEGITINAVFTGSNVLGTGVKVKNESGSDSDITEAKASNVNIGQAGEQTTYRILFDYTDTLGGKENQGFGKYQVYQGTITGLTSSSIIKFKNAGYIYGDQIANTNATILLDNTQLKSDFRGDRAILDFRNGKSGIGGNILTSDVRELSSNSGTDSKPTTNVLSSKNLTFDLTGTNTTDKKLNYTHNIQAGNKVAPNYGESDTAPSTLTFQNAPTLTLGDDSNATRGTNTNPSDFIKSLANDVGFSGIGSASTTAPTGVFDSDDNNNPQQSKASYILAGTILKFQGTNISAGSTNTITENTYDLDLNFNSQIQSGASGLGEDLSASTLTAHTIVMRDSTTARNLSLTFNGQGSLAGATIGNNANVLNVQLKENARFNLTTSSDNGLIGTLVLTATPATQAGGEAGGAEVQTLSSTSPNALSSVAKDSSLSIAEGSMSFVGNFSQNDTPVTSGANAGAINVAFNGTNKAYGTLAGKGAMSITLSGSALFSDDEAQALGFVKDSNQFADLVIDLTTPSSATLSLAHSSGMVGLIGATDSNTYTSLNLSSVTGDIALKGNFNLTEGASFGGTSTSRLKVVDDNSLSLKLVNGKALSIAEDGIVDTEGKSFKLQINGGGDNNTLTFTNLGDKISNIILSGVNNWGVNGVWNIRGTNLQISGEIGANKNLQKTFVFAKGEGTQTITSNASNNRFLNLSELSTSDKIANSTLTFTTKNSSNGFLLIDYGTLTLIGKDSLDANASTHRVDGGMSSSDKSGTSKKLSIGLYNTILRSGDVLLDNTNPNSTWGNDTIVDDNVTIRGTDIFNMSAKKGTDATKLANNSTINAVFVNGSNLVASSTPEPQNPSVRTADTASTILTGNTYIDAENGANEALKTTLSQYATSNAGGALSDSILKTLQSKAYGNITLENTVTATMKFIGSDSHSFDGKTIVEGSGTTAKVYYYQGNKTIADITGSDADKDNWNLLSIGDGTSGKINGAVYVDSNTHPTLKDSTKYAQLIGGNTNSRFDFDHTSVALDLVKFAGGKTYIYNSSISGSLSVANDTGVGTNGVTSATIPNNSSTTIYFNEQTTLQDLPTASANFISTQAENGINLDLSTAHKMTADNLTDSSEVKTLTNTSKTTNLVFIGKASVETGNTNKSNNNGDSIDLSFMPNTTLASGYANYTFINAGEFTQEQVTSKAFGDVTGSSPDGSQTIFGSSSVVLIDTYVLGDRAFAQKGFIDMGENRNQLSSWSGGNDIDQFLIFDFHQGKYDGNQDIQFNSNQADAISNKSSSSLYVFTNIFSSGTADEQRVLTLSNANGLRTAINAQLKTLTKSSNDPISNQVVGYLGLRGVSIEGDIDESVTTSSSNSQGGSESADSQVTRDAGTSNASGNRVDIVFNSTDNISYIDGFDENGEHTYSIKETGYNKVANIYGINNDKSNISGYAVLKASSTNKSNGGVVTIKGTASKDIVFIGEGSVEGGFDKLKIEGGDNHSHYTFYSVGTLSQTFLENVGLYKTSSGVQGASANDKMATAGTFTFANSTINGDINVDANTSSSTTPSVPAPSADTQTSTPSPVSKLIFDNVLYSGTLSGSLEKELVFANGSDNIVIKGGSNASSYDFSNLSKGSSINLSVDLSDSTTTNNGTQRYLSSNLTGFESGDISLTGSLKLARNRNDLSGGNNQTYSNSFAFNDDAKWTMTDSSRVMNLSLSNSGTNYNLDLYSASRSGNAIATQDDVSDNAQSTNKDLRVLEVGTLSGNGGQVLLGTSIDSNNQSNSKSDKIKASVISSGTTLYITAKDSSLNSGSFDTSGENAIVLVSADTSYGEVKGAERKQGLSYVTTALEHQVSANSSDWSKYDEESSEESNSNLSHRWVLSGFDTSTNQELVDESGFIISNPYRMLLIETNNLNKRMGDLRDNDYNHGAWIRVFNGSDSGEGSKNLYTNIQLGYDYGTPSIGAKNYSGVAFSTSIVDIDGNQYSGKANTYSVALYNAYIADSGLYVDTIGKYLYTDQKLSPTGSSDSSFGSHALSLGLEVGYRAYMGESNFYFETQAEAIGGVIFGVKDIAMGNIGGMDITGDLKTTLSLNTRVGIVQGYSLKTQSGFRADFRLGVSLVNESVNDNNSITLYDSITEASTSIANDTKAVLNVGTNLILTDQWRVYLDAERSFGGKRNVDYQANVGARFSFGEITKPLPKPEKPLPLKVGEKE